MNFDILMNEVIVVDTITNYTYIGRLEQIAPRAIELVEALIFDAGKVRIDLEKFLIECVSYGYNPSRRSVWICSEKIISATKLSAIIIPAK
jgi:hypothetical protein